MTVSEKQSEKQTLGFQAEVKQLLQLMIHSLYSNKEIFLREMISNASDAADKLRFEAINNDALYGNDHELQIKVGFDKEARTITISDNGIGMTRDDDVPLAGGIVVRAASAHHLQETRSDAPSASAPAEAAVVAIFEILTVVSIVVSIVAAVAAVAAAASAAWAMAAWPNGMT